MSTSPAPDPIATRLDAIDRRLHAIEESVAPITAGRKAVIWLGRALIWSAGIAMALNQIAQAIRDGLARG